MKNGQNFLAVAFLAVMLVAFLPFAGALTQSTGENANLGTIASPRFLPAAINAGDSVTMSVDVTNSGVTLSMDSVSAALDLGNGYFTPVSITDLADTIKPGDTHTFILKFNVNPATQPGFYSIFLNLNYLRDGQQVTQKDAISVPVAIGQKNIAVELNPKSINPGSQSILDFSLTNNGTSAISNVLFTWTEKSGLVLPVGSDNRAFAARIDPGQTVDLNYAVAADPNITTGLYSLDTNMSYIDSTGAQSQRSLVGLVVGGATDFDVSSDYSGTQLSFSIANIGANNAGAVVVKLARQPGLNVSGSSTVIIGALNKGDYSVANFTVQSAAGDTNAGGSAFRRGAGGGASPASSNATSGANASASAPAQTPSNFVVEIDYTDTTGGRQVVQKDFVLSARGTGFATGAGTGAGALAGAGQGADLTTLLAAFAVLIVGGALYNKFRAKRSWKSLGLVLAVGIIVPLAIFFLAPRALAVTILAVAFLLGAIVYFFIRRGK